MSLKWINIFFRNSRSASSCHGARTCCTLQGQEQVFQTTRRVRAGGLSHSGKSDSNASRTTARSGFLLGCVTLALLQGSLGPRGRTQLKMLRGRCMGLKESFLVNGKVLKLSGNAPSWVLEWQRTQKASEQPARRRKTAVVLCLQLPGGWHRGRKAKYNFQLRYKTYLKVHR